MLARVNGAQIYFDVEGMGLAPSGLGMVAKEPCFVLHGGPGLDHSYFKPWLSPLAETMQLIYVDHRGTGRSERVPVETCTIEQMADDVEELRKHLGLGKVSVLGNSFGGMWALVYALRYPENLSRLILVTTTPSHEFYQAAEQEIARRATPEQKATMPALFEGTVTTDEQFKRWWDVMMPLYFAHWNPVRGQEMIERGVDNPLVAAYMFAQIIPSYDVRAQLGQIRVPTLVVAGRHDWVTPVGESEQIAERIPDAEFVVFEKSGHMPFIEEQSAFIDTVKRFVTM
jgi:proline iminopeptidase